MLIIVEGPDGAGKTTFAELIVKELKEREDRTIRLQHFGEPKTDPFVEYTSLGYTSDYHLVCDRLHWGEVIYGPLYRGESLLGDRYHRVEDYLNARGAVIAYLTHDVHTLKKRHEHTGEDYLREEHVERVVTEYEAVAARSAVPVLRFRDPTVFDVFDLMIVASFMETNASQWSTL
jgi:thymidylate kinase